MARPGPEAAIADAALARTGEGVQLAIGYGAACDTDDEDQPANGIPPAEDGRGILCGERDAAPLQLTSR